ncbi:MAG: UDP-N-acetylmuramate dehydrogenase [Clostridiales bacterium]|jgi:UDP-N-acetylmuramate dehydrogenase|nr:UDP-N-acetylmuramate dehydrogenase [Clostridiales bacterium]
MNGKVGKLLDVDALLKELSRFRPLRNAPMSGYTTFGVGGPADAVFEPACGEDVLTIVRAASTRGVPYYIMGNGSNLLVRDGGVRGIVVVIGANMSAICRRGNGFVAEAGAPLNALMRLALNENLMGLEWACGIPGTVGGACAMNAGAYGGDMSQSLTQVEYIENGQIRRHAVRPGDMGYRQSVYAAPRRIVLSAAVELNRDDGKAASRQAAYLAARKEKQPLGEKSAGSVFKRPPGHYAGALIEEAGLKGRRIGGAKVSEKHAGFIVNAGGATAGDILRLIAHVRQTVRDQFGVSLTCEVKIWGED